MRTRTPFLLLLGLSALSASAATFVTGGTVSGPTTSTDNAIVRFDGTTGRTIQNSGATLDDNGTVSLTGAGSATLGLLSLPTSASTKNQGISFGADTFLYRTAAGQVALDAATGNNPNFILKDNGTTKVWFQYYGGFILDSVGAMTFRTNGAAGTTALVLDTSQNTSASGNLKAAAGLSVTGSVIAAGTGANYSVIDNNGTSARFLSYGPDTSTNGSISFLSLRSNGSNILTPLSISAAGAATFINDVTIAAGNSVSSRLHVDNAGSSSLFPAVKFSSGTNTAFVGVGPAGSIFTSGDTSGNLFICSPTGKGINFGVQNGAVYATFSSTGAATFSGLVGIGSSTPASASAAGTAGTVTWDSSYIYVCTATNTWKRAAIATW